MAKQIWMVCGGRDSAFIDEFLSRQMVAIGWAKLGDLSKACSREQISHLVEQAWPENNKFQNSSSKGQVCRFRQEIVPGKFVVTYDFNRRVYHLGTVTGDYVYHPEYDPELVHTRSVKWEKEISRDALSAGSKNCLTAISTIFALSTCKTEEILGSTHKDKSAQTNEKSSAENKIEAEIELRKDTEQRALEFLQDKLSKLDWDEMQELLAGLLRAMGYKTRISPSGPDGGRDIIASPDGFGFQRPA